MATKATTLNALAMLKITGTMRGLTYNTRIDLDRDGLITWGERAGRQLTDAGEALVVESRLWKAHKFLIDNGYTLNSDKQRKSSFIGYVKDDERGIENHWLWSAWISRDGQAWWHEGEVRATKGASFKNGK